MHKNIPFSKISSLIYGCTIALFFLFFSTTSKAQCPANIDFEYGDFTNWQCYVGYVDTSHTGPLGIPVTNYHLTYSATPVYKQQTIITSTTLPLLDPYGGFPTLCPNGSGNSIRLGNDSIGGKAEAVNYKFRIPTGQNLYSIVYQYAIVFQNPGHVPSNQPRVKLEVSDSATGLLITCASYDYVSSGVIPGFYLAPSSIGNFDSVWCKSWTPSAINLKGYGGKTIYLTFITNDCTQFGHFGYAYIDVNSQCGSNAILNAYCWNSTQATISAPSGFKTYHWYDSSLTTSIDTLQNSIVPLPTTTKWYGVICTPYPGYGCVDTFYTSITPVLPPKPTANFTVPNVYCASSILNFTNTSSSNIAGTSIVKYKWFFGDPNASGNAAPPNPDSSFLQNPQHLYSDTGTYAVTLIITTAAGCEDTIVKNVTIALPPPNVPIVSTADTVCAVVDQVTLNWNGTLTPGFTPIWTLGDRVNLISGNLLSTGPIVVNFDTIGMQYIGFTVVPPSTDDSTCWAHKDYGIYVKGFYPEINIMGTDTICYGNPTQLYFDNNSANCGSSTRACNAPDEYALVGLNAGNNTPSSPIYAFPSYPKARSQYLILGSELQSAGLRDGLLKGIEFTITSPITSSNNAALHDFTIKLACVNYSSFLTSSPYILDTVRFKKIVYTTSLYSPTLGINKFNFTSNYEWDGVSNILVEMCYDNTGFTTGLSPISIKRLSTSGTGNYYVTAIGTTTDPNNACDQSFPTTASIITSSASVRPDFRFWSCANSYVPTGTTFSWTSSPSGFSSTNDTALIAPIINTTYYATASNFGCTHSDTIAITVINSTVSAGNDTTICMSGNSAIINLSANVVGSSPLSYKWKVRPTSAFIASNSSAITTATVHANTIDTFTVTVTTASCTLYDTMIVYASKNPTITKSSDSLICGNDTIQLNVSSNQLNTSFLWTSTGDTLSCYSCSNPISIITQKDTFNFTATNSYGCITTNRIKVTPKTIPVSSFTTTSPVCENANSIVTFTGSGANGATFNWNFAGGTASPGGIVQGPQSVNWAVADTYQVSLIVNKNGCNSLPDTQSVIVLPNVTSTFSSSNAHCMGDTLTLIYTGNGASVVGATALWTIPSSATIISGNINSLDTLRLIPAVGQSIFTLYVNAGTCSAAAFSDTIIINALPTSTFSASSPICLTDSASVLYTGSALASAKYNWNFDAGNSNKSDTVQGPHKVNWATSGTKNITLSVIENGCTSAIDSQAVQVILNPTSIFTKNNAHCIGDTMKLVYTGNGKSINGSVANWIITPTPTYIIGNSNTLDSILFIPAVGQTTVQLMMELATCNAIYSDSFTIYNYPTNTFTATSLICPNDTSNIVYTGNAGGTATYNWSFDGGSHQPTSTNIVGPFKVSWSAFGNKNITLAVTENACTSAVDTVHVNVLQVPTSIFTTNLAHCSGDTLLLVYTGNANTISGSSIQWSASPSPTLIQGNLSTFDTIKFVPTSGNNFISINTFNGACVSSFNDTIQIYDYPTNSFTLSNDTGCNPISITTNYVGTALSTAIFNWNFNGSIASPGGTVGTPQTITYANAGDYLIALSVTENGCTSAIDTQRIHVIQSPTASFSKNAANCKGDTLTLTYTGTITSSFPTWVIPANATIVSGSISGTYSPLVITLDTGMNHFSASIVDGLCSNSFADSIRVYQIPTSGFSISPTTNCTSLSSTLTYTGNASALATYNWNFDTGIATPGGTTKGPQSVIWNTANTFNPSLIVTEHGCTSTSTSNSVNVLLMPTSTFTKNNPNCDGDTLVLAYTGNAASIVGATASWTLPVGSTLISGALNSFGPITAIVSTGMNHINLNVTNSICSNTTNDSILIYQIPTSAFSISPTTNCTALSSTLTYTGNASTLATYNWNFDAGIATPGGTTKGPQSVIWNTANTYHPALIVTEHGCTSSSTNNSVDVLLMPTSTFTKNNPNCVGDTLVLTYTGNAASIVGATASWTLPVGVTLLNGNPNSFGPITALLAVGNNKFSLTVSNSICTSTTSDSITIYRIPTSTFNISPKTNCTNLTTTFTYTGNASASATYNWFYATGAASPGGTTKGPQSVIYSVPLTYIPSLVVVENGCTSSLTTDSVKVLQTPTTSFTKNNPICAGDTLTLNYTGNGASIAGSTALWSFTNSPTVVSGSTTSFGTIKLIPKAGKTVILMKTSNGICSHTIRDSVVITAIPTSSFTFTNASPCINSPITITYSGNAPVNATYNWNFGGATTSPGGTVKGPHTLSWNSAGNKTVSLVVNNNGCTSTNTASNFNVVPITATSFTMADTKICSGSSTLITYTGSNSATSYSWTVTGNHTPTTLTGKGPHLVKWTNTSSNNSTEKVILKVTQNGCLSYPDTNSIIIVPKPIAAFSTNSPICPYDSLRVNFTGSNNTLAANYKWEFTGNSFSDGSGIGPYTLTYSSSGKYPISLYVTQDNCVSDTIYDSILIQKIPFVAITNDTTICEGNTVQLTATGANSYLWGNGLGINASIQVTPLITTIYSVEGSNGACIAKDIATIKVAPYPIADAGRDTMIPVNTYIDLGTTTTAGYHYTWTQAATLSNAYISNPIATPSDSTMYILTVNNDDGCISTDSVIILVGRCYKIGLANTFTPNGDGENDNFGILNTRQLTSLQKFDIYNRWGEKVFSSSDIHNSRWDGNYHGAMQEIGTYVYIIQATCLTGETINLKGSLELIR